MHYGHRSNAWNKLHGRTTSGITRLVSPGTATEGAPLFLPEKNWRPFSVITVCLSVLQCHPYLFSPAKLTTFFAHHCHFYWITRVSSPWRCHPAPFLPVRPRLSTTLCKFTHYFFPSGVTLSPWRVSSGVVRPLPRPPQVTPLRTTLWQKETRPMSPVHITNDWKPTVL